MHMTLPTIVVVGGSYVGVKTAQTLAIAFHHSFKVLLIEKNSHFQHLFAYPRFAVTDKCPSHKAFIPFKPGTFAACPPGSGSVVQARVVNITRDAVRLDREVALDSGYRGNLVPYSYLVIATGTKLTPPSTLPGSEKLDGVQYLDRHVKLVQRAQRITVIGGGAVGVQTVTDIKELYPEKQITLVHSRQHLMNKFDSRLHDIIAERMNELDVQLVLGSRVKLPAEGYPTSIGPFQVELQDGRKIESDFAIVATGQTPQSALIQDFLPESIDASGFINTRKTLQIDAADAENVFVVGDIAHTGAPKAARPGFAQAEVIAKNIQHLMNEEKLEDYSFDPAGIHLTLGITKNVIFRNPAREGEEPMIKMQDNGRLDMGIDDVWTRRGGGEDYHL